MTKTRKNILIILLITIFLSFNLIIGNVVKGHDYSFHCTNMSAGINLIKNGHLFLRTIFNLPTLANGFGYGSGLFYPPLSYYLTSYIGFVINIFGVPISYTLSIFNYLIIFLSALSMYYLVNKIYKNENAALLGSISYITFPYLLCNIYVRTSLAEQLTFIFIPLALASIYDLKYEEGKKFQLLFVTSYIGMIYSHLVMTIYLTIFIIILLLLDIKKIFTKEKILKLVKASLIVLLITSPFTITILQHKLGGNYVVYQPNKMYSINQIFENSLYIRDLFLIKYKTTTGIVVYFNYASFIAAVIALIKFKKTKLQKSPKNCLGNLIIATSIFIIMTTKYFPWDLMPNFLKLIQFPWRLQIYLDILISLLCSLYVININQSKLKKTVLILCVLMTIIGNMTINKNMYSFAETNISKSNLGLQKEYLPVNTKENYDYYLERSNEIILKKGELELTEIENNEFNLKYNLKLTDGEAIIELPRLYYLGYTITLKDTNNQKTKLKYYENEYGFIELKVNNSGTLEVEYTGTTLSNVFRVISYLTVIIYIFIEIMKNKNKQIKICDIIKLRKKRSRNEKRKNK